MRDGRLRRSGPRPAPRGAAWPGTHCASPRVDAARALRIDDQVGTLVPGKRADLTVVSLAGSPYHPVEDPAAAVVFGGSPDRVLETIVDGEDPLSEGRRGAVARGTQHRKRRPAQNARSSSVAAPPHKQKPPQWQEELFFQRLRDHAKWAFVLLAVVFALGFVFFGVGSGSTGISDALQNAFNFGNKGGSSISKPPEQGRQASAGCDGLAQPRHRARAEAAGGRTR